MIYLAVLLMTLVGAAGAFFLKGGMDRVTFWPPCFALPASIWAGAFIWPERL